MKEERTVENIIKYSYLYNIIYFRLAVVSDGCGAIWVFSLFIPRYFGGLEGGVFGYFLGFIYMTFGVMIFFLGCCFLLCIQYLLNLLFVLLLFLLGVYLRFGTLLSFLRSRILKSWLCRQRQRLRRLKDRRTFLWLFLGILLLLLADGLCNWYILSNHQRKRIIIHLLG